jgi:putative nucleotidyltransferase with HDIG domain
MLIANTLLQSFMYRLRWKLWLTSSFDHRRRLLDSSSNIVSEEKVVEKGMLNAAETTMLRTLMSACDDDTYEHSYRIALVAQEVARGLKLSLEEVGLVYLAALLHDIGKVSIPRAILKKGGPLDEDEQRIMQQHPQIGQYLLTQVGGIFGQLGAIVVAHHERWDGLGYPEGLVGELVPLLARIVAVVDSFDAMTSARGYREPLSEEEASEELENCAGSQYDPCVVAAFLSIRDTRIVERRSRAYPPLIARTVQVNRASTLYV